MNSLIHVQSSTYFFFSLCLQCSSSASCHFSATTAGWLEETEQQQNHSAHPHFHMDLMEMVFLLDAVKIGDKSLAMKRNTGYFQYFQAWVMVAVFQLALWGWIQNKLLLQIKMNMLEVLAQVNPFLSNHLVNQKTDCWTVNLSGQRMNLRKALSDQGQITMLQWQQKIEYHWFITNHLNKNKVYKNILWTDIFSFICKKMINGMK